MRSCAKRGWGEVEGVQLGLTITKLNIADMLGEEVYMYRPLGQNTPIS
jgi:hypothetical protein